jgi:RES domain-containing protein
MMPPTMPYDFGETWISQRQHAGLIGPSAIKPVFAIIEHLLVIRKIGKLAAGDQDNLKQAIREMVG